uniref:Ig-like domain-containing protein n=1 Tax=Oryzias melastigma TaxID=30732 RepID=A0A3B3DDC4_ORYME
YTVILHVFSLMLSFPTGSVKVPQKPGLCVVIPCSFTTPSYFKPQHLIWFKCESNKICFHSEKIFHTNKNTPPYKSEFMGRVSLLDPDVNHQNCSIRISDLRESDSGFYQLRVNGYIEKYFFPQTVFLLTKHVLFPAGFRQKPTMTLPDLTEGHQTTLTCSAPALCSTSPPGISWMWRGTLTAVTQRHNSTLTFIPTAELHNSNITCRIRFSDNTTTEETVNLHRVQNWKLLIVLNISVPSSQMMDPNKKILSGTLQSTFSTYKTENFLTGQIYLPVILKI